MKIVLKPSGILWLSVLFYLSPASTASFLAAVLIHELGHLTALYLMGKQPETLTISISSCTISAYGLTYQEELYSAAAGPFTSLIGGLFYPRFSEFAIISLLLAVFNLLPIAGLDGGRVFSSLLALKAPQREILAGRISRLTLIVILTGAILCAFLFPSQRVFPLIAAVFLAKTFFLLAAHADL